MTMADRIVVMHDGIVEQIGSPLELYDNPANMFVAGFIGSPAMNFIPGTLRRGGNGAALEAAGGMRIALPNGVPGDDGQKVTLGTRPEHLAIGADGNGITGSILVVEPTGAETQVVVEAAQQQVVAVFSERHHFQPGAKITLTPRPEALHLFDSSSGRHLASH
jgi:multiple sugar transport system ATP-binding protein